MYFKCIGNTHEVQWEYKRSTMTIGRFTRVTAYTHTHSFRIEWCQDYKDTNFLLSKNPALSSWTLSSFIHWWWCMLPFVYVHLALHARYSPLAPSSTAYKFVSWSGCAGLRSDINLLRDCRATYFLPVHVHISSSERKARNGDVRGIATDSFLLSTHLSVASLLSTHLIQGLG